MKNLMILFDIRNIIILLYKFVKLEILGLSKKLVTAYNLVPRE